MLLSPLVKETWLKKQSTSGALSVLGYFDVISKCHRLYRVLRVSTAIAEIWAVLNLLLIPPDFLFLLGGDKAS
jgi:hypothetical protein